MPTLCEGAVDFNLGPRTVFADPVLVDVDADLGIPCRLVEDPHGGRKDGVRVHVLGEIDTDRFPLQPRRQIGRQCLHDSGCRRITSPGVETEAIGRCQCVPLRIGHGSGQGDLILTLRLQALRPDVQ